MAIFADCGMRSSQNIQYLTWLNYRCCLVPETQADLAQICLDQPDKQQPYMIPTRQIYFQTPRSYSPRTHMQHSTRVVQQDICPEMFAFGASMPPAAPPVCRGLLVANSTHAATKTAPSHN